MTREPFAGRVIAFDPGNTTGVAIFHGNGYLESTGQLSLDDLTQMATKYEHPVSVIIYEDFIVWKKKASSQAGSRMPASQAIGMIKVLAAKTGAHLAKQPVERKDEGARITQVFEPSDHSQSHHIAAYNHGAYWLNRVGLFQSSLDVEKFGRNAEIGGPRTSISVLRSLLPGS